MTNESSEGFQQELEIDMAEREKLMGQAYSAAQKDIREAHKDEFNVFYQKRLAERGIIWEPKKSKAEQALDQILELMQAHPDLAEKLAVRLASHE